MSSSSQIENLYVKFWIEDDILFCMYKKSDKIDLHAAKKIVKDRTELTGNFSYPCFTDHSQVKEITKEARGYLAAKENAKGITKAAFLVTSSFSKIVINFFLFINKPMTPCKVFNTKDNALEWLKKK